MELLLNRLADQVAQSYDLESLTRPMLELLETVTGLQSTYLTTIDEHRGVQHILYARNSHALQIPEGLSVPWGDTLCKRALDQGQPYASDVASRWGDSDAARTLGIKTYVSQPVHTADGTLYGTLCAASGDCVNVMPATLNVLALFARLIAQQIEREALLERLRQSNQELSSRATTDTLTGVANRRGLYEALGRMLAHARRESVVVQLAFIDLDGFKPINDQFGHAVGDRFLVHIASRLLASVRASDVVGRYGGDEFVVIAIGDQPEELAQRLEQAIQGIFMDGEIVLDYPGASIGVVSASPDEGDAEALIRRADQVMYQMKTRRKAARA
ncbi:diguanylate cyclase with gaf sensor [Oceanococcus atlanticus]|uniref:diguanylate cyclase n=1 Tax=Oceanococcus atlanticus TaxID=1317117 RepID=A0A1Y1SIT5_9GAMM|nr:sensor domain-containing diguanylate cyclase [Oceanococcus atlanticus]ORE89567.1 diguanylate cyclase with gaf sensor [Oceanococcus atlanticus]RZO83554.1 MAG: sensor domain-containing diguanylate cyclase [Oceanococcus sp.]